MSYVVVAIRAIFLFLKELDDRIFPLSGDFFRYPNIDKDVAKTLHEFGVVEA